ncbi:MAG: DUF58 domain-containing protein [Phycisphaeraceae bacterium]|nr:DUF58 domain-containing protein [Phycisphaeraceae bacterium]
MPRRLRDPLTHPKSRLEIGPGGMMFFVVTGLILAVAIYSQANLLFWAFGLMIGSLLVSAMMSWQMLSGVSVQRMLPSHGVANEMTVLRYTLVNRKRWLPAFGVVVSESWGRGANGWRKAGPVVEKPRRLKGRPHGWVLHLGPNQRVQAEAPCWPVRRGQLRFEKIVVSTSFPFGIVRRVLMFEQPGQLLVYPHLYRLNRRVLFKLSEADPHGRKRLERAGGHEEFFGLREYRPGDSLKTIDWKRSAKTSKLISREMTQPSPPKIMLALDLSQVDEPVVIKPRGGLFKSAKAKNKTGDDTDLAVERAIRLAASVVCDAYFHGYQIGVVVLGVPCTPFPVHHSLPHRTRILDALSQLDVQYRMKDSAPMPGLPSVVIRPGSSGGVSVRPTTMVLSAADMDQYVSEFEDGTESALTRRVAPTSRRDEMLERQPVRPA